MEKTKEVEKTKAGYMEGRRWRWEVKGGQKEDAGSNMKDGRKDGRGRKEDEERKMKEGRKMMGGRRKMKEDR
jgi:hypothetical protein